MRVGQTVVEYRHFPSASKRTRLDGTLAKLAASELSWHPLSRNACAPFLQGHHPDLHLEGWNKVSIVLNTHSVGGLTENDFIMAAKINDIDVADLKKKPKQKFWA